MSLARNDWVFGALVAAFLSVYFLYYPATYAIDDECNILSLAYSIAHGTVFLDQAGIDLDADLVWNGHRISKFSPFHAALLSPAVATRWRLAFLITAAFFVFGGFVLRAMLRREGLSSAWTVLYFANPGMLYYSQTLMAMVPAAVIALLGASLLYREQPRPAAAAAALGGAVLLHIWLAPVAILLSLGWWLENGRQLQPGIGLVLGAAPGVALLALYNWLTTGSPLRNAYSIIGHYGGFDFHVTHVTEFFPFYLISLLLTPIAGWAVFLPKYAGNRTLPITVAATVTLASAYYYRDGIQYGLAGWVPGQRFLLPASVLACLPAARYLVARSERWTLGPRQVTQLQVAGVCGFALSWAFLASQHQAFLQAHAEVQQTIRIAIPSGARVVANGAFKEFAPVNGHWTLRLIRGDDVPDLMGDGTYRVWIGQTGELPPPRWFSGYFTSITHVESWIWRRDLWIGTPASSALTDKPSS